MFRFFEARDAGDNVFNENNDYFLWWGGVLCTMGPGLSLKMQCCCMFCTTGSHESLLSFNWPREMMRNPDGDVAAT